MGTADAGDLYSGLPNADISLSGATAGDADGDATSYSWTVDSTNCSFDDDTLLNPNLTCTVAGSYTATLTVSDGIDNTSDSAAVTVLTPEEAITDVLADIQLLVDTDVLNAGQANGISRPLNNALRSLDSGHTADACNQLQDFIDEVYAKTPVPLDAPTAAALIADAQAIRTYLDCN